MADKHLLSVTVRGRQGLIFEGEAISLSSINRKGPFDVLPLHANFVSTLEKKLIIIRPGGRKEELNVQSGLVQVYEDKVLVFLGIV